MFSALRNGFSDLYVLDLETTAVRPLTTDAYADLQPSWSPDGRTIAFSTDRFSSSMQTLTFGNFRLGLLDVDSAAITELPGIPDAKHIDPHWSADGASLYFIADAAEHEQHLSCVDRRGKTLQGHRCLHRCQRGHCPESGAGHGGTDESARIQRVSSREV